MFWLVSVPKGDNDAEFNRLRNTVMKERDLATAYKFPIPNLRVGTLDALMALSDDLYKIDAHVEGVMRRIANLLFSALNEQNNNASATDEQQTLTAPGGIPIESYCTRFAWDEAKYPTKTSLRTLVNIISKSSAKFEDGVKTRAIEWSSTLQQLSAMQRRKEGSLLVRELDASIVQPQDNVIDTEYMQTLLVIIPLGETSAFEKSYEKLAPMIVPRSGRRIAEDNEAALYRVVLFRKYVDEFKVAARDKRWTVREYVAKEGDDEGASASALLQRSKEKQEKQLVRWCRGAFAEVFVAWVHLKAIKIFVESVLRYCLPPNFVCVLLNPHANAQPKLRSTLNSMYANLTPGAGIGDDVGDDDEMAAAAAAASGPQSEFYKYVFSELNLEF